LHRQQQMSILWAHSCILSMTLQVNSGPIRAHRQIPPSVLGLYMGLMQFPYMCLVGPYEAHTEYIFMGPYIYMHLSYTMGPHWLYQGVREIVMWALPSTMTQICVMGLLSCYCISIINIVCCWSLDIGVLNHQHINMRQLPAHVCTQLYLSPFSWLVLNVDDSHMPSKATKKL